MKADLALIHAPGYYDFRKKRTHWGPVSDVVPSYQIFDMIPYGFLTITSYLMKHGFKVRIVNLAARMLMSDKFDAEREIRKLKAKAYGIDLHWLPTVHGALEVAKLVKKHHPESPVILGGLTSTYFARELIESYPFIDYVVLGDTTEEPLKMLLERIDDRIDDVPNLAYRRGGFKVNPMNYVPNSLDEFAIDYRLVIKAALRGGLSLSIPFANFFREPIGCVIAFKGCTYNCVTCGGSKYAYKYSFGRKRMARKSVSAVFEEFKSLTSYFRIPVFFIGDPRLFGGFHELSRLIREEKVDNELLFEFFSPPPRELLEDLRRAGGSMIQLSPESPNEEVRRAFGRPYGNRELTKFVEEVMGMGFKRLDLYFMLGLPKQTPDMTLEASKFIESLYLSYPKHKELLTAFQAPLAPFIDPGSLAFEHPKLYGYRLRFRSLEEHRKALEARSWVDMLNYESFWMSRKELARATYLGAIGLAEVKANYGLMKEDEANSIIKRMKLAIEVLEGRAREEELYDLSSEIVSKRELYPTISALKMIRKLPI